MVSSTACLRILGAGLTAWIATEAEAQTLTKFPPDIVMECHETGTSKVSRRCEYQCFSIPRPADGPISTWPSIAWNFEKIEFFSKPGRDSENWLIAVRGRNREDAWLEIRTFFVTIGTGHLCNYVGARPGTGIPGAEVILAKYY